MRTTMMMGAALALALGAATARAAEDEGQAARVGADTRAWLDLQASGNASQGAPRPMPGEVADKVYERYLDSFDNRIPDEFDRESFVSAGGGS